MESPPDAVAIEILDYVETVAARSPLDRSAQITKSSAGLSGVHGIALSKLCRLQKSGGNRGHIAHGNADPCIREVAIQLGGHVKVHQVAIVQLALERRNAVGGFVIDADARGARKSVGHSWSGSSSVAAEYLSTHGVEFTGSRAGSDGLYHRLAGFGDNPTSTNERIEVFLLVNRHAAILRRQTWHALRATYWGRCLLGLFDDRGALFAVHEVAGRQVE